MCISKFAGGANGIFQGPHFESPDCRQTDSGVYTPNKFGVKGTFIEKLCHLLL